MKYIANIITKSKIELSCFFNISSSLEDVDVSIPTLIIGWKEVKEYFPEQDILNNKICDNIYWTFSKREKRHRFENDINNFIEIVNDFIEKNVNYRFFNYVLSNQTKRDNFISYINKGHHSIYYNSRFIYIYDISTSTTFGVSLKDLNFIGIKTKCFIDKLNVNNNNIITDNLNFIDNQSLHLIKDNIKIVPFLNYLKNEDIY